MKNFTTQKLALSVVAIALLFSVATPRAHAQTPTGPFVPVYSSIEDATSRVHAAFQDIGKMSRDMLMYQAGQLMLNQLTQNTLAWIRGGFNGSPSFAVDPQQLFIDLQDMNAITIANQIRGISMCEFNPTFKNDLANALELSTRSNAANKFAARVACPFDQLNVKASDFFGDAPGAFVDNGGWASFATALNDSGNSFGGKLLVSSELAQAEKETADAQKQKLTQSGGFNDVPNLTQCNYPAGSEKITDPKQRALLAQTWCKTATPGKVVGDLLSKTTGVDMDRLGFADSMNKIVSAFVQQLEQEAINGVFK